jgi:1-acyl-sn-glycerol-3-phosphate acyltransferase
MTDRLHGRAMRRALLGLWTYFEFFVVALVWLPLHAVVALIHGNRDPGRRIRGRWMRRFGRVAYRFQNLWRFSAEGAPPPDIRTQPYVVVANHESTADPFLLCWLRWDMRWVAKEDLFRIPWIGWMLRCGGDIPLRRGHGESIKEMMAECRRTLAAGVPVMMFPEGTRSPDGRLLPFKDGAFALAIEAGVPVLPLAIAGTRDCRPKGSVWFGEARARVRVLEPVSTAGMTAADLPRLKELVRDRIAEGVEAVRAELGIAAAPVASASRAAVTAG